ncbi:hypothetical protein L596_018239 [Steinernema carpocapsae]|uniref:Protein kinase domain-containing protein n=1 Tax=Steinernema carpocapsae TaxID=34508 RepID=A0A4U5N431_STECR|nr:hypothetical protein L596_018239 [Steinernema carpocapsae]
MSNRPRIVRSSEVSPKKTSILCKKKPNKNSATENTQFGSVAVSFKDDGSSDDFDMPPTLSEKGTQGKEPKRKETTRKKQTEKKKRGKSLVEHQERGQTALEKKRQSRRATDRTIKANPWGRVYNVDKDESYSDLDFSTTASALTDRVTSVIIESPKPPPASQHEGAHAHVSQNKLKTFMGEKWQKIKKGDSKEQTHFLEAEFDYGDWLPVGTTIRTAVAKYEVRDKLIGDNDHTLYKVRKLAEKQYTGEKKRYFALKCDKRGYTNHLKAELRFLRMIHTMPGIDHKKFVQFIDHGCDENFAFIVQQLMGPNLERLRSEILRNDFTPATALRLAEATLSCVEEIHRAGYLHRAIALSAFNIGLGKSFIHVALLSCGFVRRFRQNNRTLKPLREKGEFVGHLLYASLAAHEEKDLSRKDDLESWFYMTCYMFASMSLTWRTDSDRGLVAEKKRSWRKDRGDIAVFKTQLPQEFRFIMTYIDALTHQDDPNYTYIHSKLRDAMKRLKIAPNQQYDWEKFGEPPIGETPNPNWTPGSPSKPKV